MERKTTMGKDVKRILLVVAAALICALNFKTFVYTGNLFPGGFSGLSLLIIECLQQFMYVTVPYSVIYLALNVPTIYIGFKFIGKKFTAYSCIFVVVFSLVSDMIPVYTITSDMLLIVVFGGIINGAVVGLCLLQGATAGGTDFISIYFAERCGKDVWNYILVGNMVVLILAGLLKNNWEVALYSIIFQYCSTQVLSMIHKRYKKVTLFVITKKYKEVYKAIRKVTNHDATLLKGIGCYSNEEKDVLFSVINSDEVGKMLVMIREIDPKAFIDVVKTEELEGHFYMRPND